MSRRLVICWLARFSRSGLLFTLCLFTYWFLFSYSVVLALESPTLISDILGNPDEFFTTFKSGFEEKLNDFIGLLVSFFGMSLVIRSLVKS